mmetsp:Transcript_14363/g.25734  ORF Transcript_14363/g.25734 Transcript_14363/m.25734 type:complete len:571 (-) Transcript_14363:38-1750(-)
MLRKKPLWVIQAESDSAKHRVYGLFSLLAVGIGGAVGSGIFVLSGEISLHLAGPATCLSWLIGGFVCGTTALAYAELSTLVPSGGSAYSYAYYSMGEVFAVLGAWLLTLEYGVSAAAVARSWGDKVAFYASELEVLGCSNNSTCWLNSANGTTVNPAGSLLCVAAVIILLCGVEFGRDAVNTLFVLKCGLVFFVIMVGFWHFEAENMSPFLATPSEYVVGGIEGVFKGTTLAFFGFIGFDEVTVLTLEAVRPQRDIPVAILGTIAVITTLYILASTALVGMIPYHLIDPDEGFGSAFRHIGAQWAVHVVMIGQILVVLPTVVLVSFLPQSRLLASVARDGLLPNVFAYTNEHGTLVGSIVIAGTIMSTIALLVPFVVLDQLISAGILIAFNLANTSLLVVRLGNDGRALRYALAINACTISNGFAAVHKSSPVLLAVLYSVLAMLLFRTRSLLQPSAEGTFSAPLVPFTPTLALSINWYLVAQVSDKGLIQVTVLLIAAVLIYLVRPVYRILCKKQHLGTKDMEEIELSGLGGWHQVRQHPRRSESLDEADIWLPRSPSIDGSHVEVSLH